MKTAILLFLIALMSVPFFADQTTPGHSGKDDPSAIGQPDDNDGNDDDGAKDDVNGNESPEVVENDAFQISSPAPHESIGDSLKMKGKARVFEATFQYELLNGEVVVAKDVIMASAGAPEWGSFEEEIHLDLDRKFEGPLVLKIFTASPKDGSETNVLEIPLETE